MAIIGAILDHEIGYLAIFFKKKTMVHKNTGTIGPFSLPSGYLLQFAMENHHAINR
jgi:hypothetical protein